MTITDSSTLSAPAGLFLARFEIGGQLPGAPLFSVTFTVYTPEQSLAGMGRITQAVNPPLDLATKLDGDFTYMTVMPDQTHVLVVATGYPVVKSGGGILPPNVHLRMVLEADWQSGTANYGYEVDGTWHEVTDAPVRQVA